MSFTVVIPARFASTRLPGKPLADLAGKTMLQRVWEQACRSGAERVIIATDDVRIAEAGRGFAAEVCMTSAEHPSGTDRLAEVTRLLQLPPRAIVVNVQGDEPRIPPPVIDQVAANLAAHPEAGMATLCVPVAGLDELRDPNAVKVVMDERGMALYFSRAPIPWPRDAMNAGATELPPGQWWRHLGLYAYRCEFLQRFVGWPPAGLEQLEQLEQLRALAQSEKIHVAPACAEVPAGVDTPADLARVRAELEAGT